MSNDVKVKLLQTRFIHPITKERYTPGDVFSIPQASYDGWKEYGIFELLGESVTEVASPKRARRGTK